MLSFQWWTIDVVRNTIWPKTVRVNDFGWHLAGKEVLTRGSLTLCAKIWNFLKTTELSKKDHLLNQKFKSTLWQNPRQNFRVIPLTSHPYSRHLGIYHNNVSKTWWFKTNKMQLHYNTSKMCKIKYTNMSLCDPLLSETCFHAWPINFKSILFIRNSLKA